MADIHAVPVDCSPAFPGRLSWEHNLGVAMPWKFDFASTIGMIGRIRRPMSTTKCVCAVTRTEKEGVLHQALVKQVGADWRVAAAEPRRWISGKV